MRSLPASDAAPPHRDGAWWRHLHPGQWLAILGLILGPAVLVFTFFTADRFASNPAIWPSAVVVVVVVSILANGVIKGSRLAFGILAAIAALQLVTWVTWMAAEPELAHPMAPVMYGMILLGLWLARDRFWKRGA